ncbi:MAG: DUF6483 family protein [Clostridium celatum]|nr:DUF6483 family protein [Clostridium celatum]MDU4979789.1 DUF6483 family protein [Clostridium celatum]
MKKNFIIYKLVIKVNTYKSICEVVRNMGKILLKNQDINLDTASSSDFIAIILKGLILKKEFNKAENILFEEIEKNKSDQMYKIALDFYEVLSEKINKELLEGNFSKEEVLQGLKDIEAIFNKR